MNDTFCLVLTGKLFAWRLYNKKMIKAMYSFLVLFLQSLNTSIQYIEYKWCLVSLVY